jgi:hypothetical protein
MINKRQAYYVAQYNKKKTNNTYILCKYGLKY